MDIGEALSGTEVRVEAGGCEGRRLFKRHRHRVRENLRLYDQAAEERSPSSLTMLLNSSSISSTTFILV